MSFNRRILVVDDEEEIIEVFRSVLQSDSGPATSQLDALSLLLQSAGATDGNPDSDRGFDLADARQGQQGVALVKAALAENRPYAVIFVDMRMPPGWNGVRTIKEIRRLDPHAQIVIVTAYADASVSEIANEVGYTDRLLYLKKPFDDEEILQLADSLTARWNLEKKVHSFLGILEGIFSSLADLNLLGDDETLRPFLKKILRQLADFLDTEDVFLAKIRGGQIEFRVGLGKFANGIIVRPEFLRIVQKVIDTERLEDVFRIDNYVVMPILLRSCKNVVVGAVNGKHLEGVDKLLEVLANNAAKILDQGVQVQNLCKEVATLREREKSLLTRLHRYEADQSGEE